MSRFFTWQVPFSIHLDKVFKYRFPLEFKLLIGMPVDERAGEAQPLPVRRCQDWPSCCPTWIFASASSTVITALLSSSPLPMLTIAS